MCDKSKKQLTVCIVCCEDGQVCLRPRRQGLSWSQTKVHVWAVFNWK